MSCGCGQTLGRTPTRSWMPTVVRGAQAIGRGVEAGGGGRLWWLPMAALAGVGLLIYMGGKKKRRKR